MFDTTLKSDFLLLRKDIQEFFARNLKSAETYFLMWQEQNYRASEHELWFEVPDVDRYGEFLHLKNNLEKICGAQASPETFDIDMFSKAVMYLKRRMLV